MKRFLVLSLVLSMGVSLAAYAEEADTYSGRFLQQYTKKLTEVETQLQKDQEARNAEIEKKRQQNNEVVSKKLQEIEKQRAESEAEFAKKLENLNKQVEANRAEMNKKMEAQSKALEDARKQADENAKIRQEKFEKKKQLWKELISE